MRGQDHRVYPNKEIIVSETGWPSGGSAEQAAVPSPQNAAAYFKNFVSWARAKNRKYLYFEAYDEAWKTAAEGDVGATWGLWTGHEDLKPGMLDVFSGLTVPDNWSSASIFGGPGTASIQFTVVPPKEDTRTLLQGQVLHVQPSAYYVAVFIRVNGGCGPNRTGAIHERRSKATERSRATL